MPRGVVDVEGVFRVFSEPVPLLTPAALRKQIAAGDTAPLYMLVGEDDVEKSAVAGEFADLVQHVRLAEMHHYGTRILAGPNWKVAFDGYVDFYHLPVLHKNTFGPDMSPDAMFHPIGAHQRITGPRAVWSKLEETPEEEWEIDDLTGGVWSIFPHGSIAGFDVGVSSEDL